MAGYVTLSLYTIIVAALVCHINAVPLSLPTDCHLNKTMIVCNNRSLTVFPKIPDSVLFLDISENKIQTIPELGKSVLKVLNTSQNAINSIVDYAFKDMEYLETLDISENDMTGDHINQLTFEGLSAVENIILRGNPLGHLQENAFDFGALRDLRYLDVSYCKLNTIHQYAWADLRRVETITLRGNNLSNIGPIFHNLNTLLNLDISDNALGEIGENVFYPLYKLRNLHLTNCDLSNLRDYTFKGLESLDTLNLAKNKFDKIPFAAFSKIALKRLDLSGNPLQAINFSSVPLKIQSIRLDNVYGFYKIGPNTFANIGGLRSVHIQNNKRFWKLDEDAFGEARWNISRLHLRNNGLETLPQNLVPWNNVHDLQLDGNMWDCDCNLKWMHDVVLANGKKINLLCSNPAEHRGKHLQDIDPGSLTCLSRNARMTVGIVAAAALTVLLIIVIVFYRKNLRCRMWWRKMLCCGCACSTCCKVQYGRDKNGRYVSVFTKDADEPMTTILTGESMTTMLSGEDKVELTNAVDV